MISISRLLPVFAAACFSAALLTAQFDSGQVSGFVRDASGATVPNAAVTATNEGTRETRKTTSNAEGYYVFPQLIVGSWSVSVEASGFKRYVKTGIVLNAESKVSVDVDLSVGAISDSVQVSASTAEVQTDSAQVASAIETKQIQNLTLNGRNPIYLAALTPGVVGGQGIGTFDPDSVSNGSFNINGGRPDEYVVAIDGAVATRTRSSGSMLGALDVDTVQEVQVLTADYSAEYGRSSAGQIRFVTKSGTRDLHGDLVENFRNSALDANTWLRNHSPDPKTSGGAAPYRFNQYGFDVGGPVFIPRHLNADRNKLFFFWAEEWTKRRYETTNTGTVPSAAMRNGDFSELLIASNPFFKKVRVINDPTTSAPFAGNVIPVSRISHNGQALLNVFPLPVAGFQQGTTNWIGSKSTHSDLRKDTFKFDYLINEKEHFSIRGGYDPWHFNAPFEDTFGRMEEIWSRPNRVGAVSLTSTFSPTFINEFTCSANSDGKGDIGFGSYCTACMRSTY
ncbi:MAG TPA: carboxypeptidase regulatory-like domain-containing protein, partial [Bryobacteraceae bacterium]|nr:carboxypeptidase regulatory-like domain-containing protein [Bryobacteraceae bacterium]